MEAITLKTQIASNEAIPRNFREIVAKYPENVRSDPSYMVCGPGFICEYLHVEDSVYRNVYEPSEDTFLLVDALHVDLPDVLIGRQISNVIEVG